MFMGSLTYAKLFDDSMSPFLGYLFSFSCRFSMFIFIFCLILDSFLVERSLLLVF